MDDDVKPVREPLAEGRFESPFDPPEERSAAAERLELRRCDPVEPGEPGTDVP